MKSYWIESTKKDKRKYQKLEKNIDVDVCVIGGGITGISCAYELAKAGKSVVLIEKDEIGESTTGGTTGKITSQHGLFYKYLIDSNGKEYAKDYLEANEEAIKKIKSIIDEEEIECNFEYQDAVIYTEKEDEVIKIKEEVEALKEIGYDAEFLTKSSLPFDIHGGIKFKGQAQFNIRKYILKLGEVIEKNGGKIYEHSKVVDIATSEEKNIVYLENNEINCEHVIIATHYPIINSPGFYFLKMYQSMSYAIAIETEKELFSRNVY